MSLPRVIKFRMWGGVGSRMFYDIPNVMACLQQQMAHDAGKRGLGTLTYDHIGENGSRFMQFTGLHDKNGKEIYEGDIIEFDAREWGESPAPRWEVTWDAEEGQWQLGGGSTHRADGCWREVIGNVHEHSHLLKR